MIKTPKCHRSKNNYHNTYGYFLERAFPWIMLLIGYIGGFIGALILTEKLF